MLIGVPDFGAQQTDVVAVAKGAPRAGSLLVEAANVRSGDFKGSAAKIVTADGSVRTLPISGEGRTLGGSSEWDFLTFYAPAQTVASIAGSDGYTSLGLRLNDASRGAAERTVAAVRDQLRATTGFTAFGDLPTIREPGSYPGKADFESMASVLNVVSLLALISALVLLSNTMTTLVGEQTAEIAAMKAIGARRRDIRRIYLRTAGMFGVLGSVLGVALGIVISNLVVRLLRAAVLRHRRPVRHLGAGDPRREPGRRARRPAARGAARRAARRTPAAQRGAASLRVGSRRSGSARCAAAARAAAAAVGPDRPARRRAPQAPHGRDGAAGRPRGRDLPRAALARLRCGGVHARVVRRQPLRHLDPAAGRQGARLRHRPRHHRRRWCQRRATVAEQRREDRHRRGRRLGAAGPAADRHPHRREVAGTAPPRSRARPASRCSVARSPRPRAPPSATASRSAPPTARRPSASSASRPTRPTTAASCSSRCPRCSPCSG